MKQIMEFNVFIVFRELSNEFHAYFGSQDQCDYKVWFFSFTYLEIQTTTTNNTLDRFNSIDSFDWSNDWFQKLLGFNQGCFISIIWPLASPFTSYCIKLNAVCNSNHCSDWNKRVFTYERIDYKSVNKFIMCFVLCWYSKFICLPWYQLGTILINEGWCGAP